MYKRQGIEWEAGTPEAEKFYRFLHDEMGVAKVRFPESSSFGVKPDVYKRQQAGSRACAASSMNKVLNLRPVNILLAELTSCLLYTSPKNFLLYAKRSHRFVREDCAYCFS